METDALVVAKPPVPATDTAIVPFEPADVESGDNGKSSVESSYCQRLKDVLVVTSSLGFVTFGDSSSQAAIIQDQICTHWHWMTNETFMELFALSRAIPGPLPTQLVMGSAIIHAGWLGGFLALIVWVLPGLCVLTGAGLLVEVLLDPEKPPIFLLGIAPATVALVFKAAYGFGSTLDKFGLGLSLSSMAGAILVNGDLNIKSTDSQFVYPIMLAIGGFLTLIDATLNRTPLGSYSIASSRRAHRVSGRIGIPLIAGAMIFQLWLIILLAAMLVDALFPGQMPNLELFQSFFRIGSVIFGGGEDVLAMMKTQMVPKFLTREQFFQGLGLSQALPGPIFNFSAFIGAVYQDIPGAICASLGLFLPSYLFMLIGMSLWARLRMVYWFKAILKGVNAVAIGFIGAACIFLWESSVHKAADAIICVISLGLCGIYNISAPIVILLAAVLGVIFEKAQWAQVPYN